MTSIIIIAIFVFVATILGGYFALKFKDKLHLILGFSAGAVLGIAFMDLFPESIELVRDIPLVMYIVLGSVLVYMIVDRIFLGGHHNHNHDNKDVQHNENENRGIVRATSLVFHSFLDGLAIGFSFQVSTEVGVVVAIAVLAHDFSDGINTVATILKGGNNKKAKIWLLADALAPVLGIIIGSMVLVKEKTLGIVLSIFTGFFIYIALADMIPESFHAHPKRWTTIATILGVGFIVLVMQFANF